MSTHALTRLDAQPAFVLHGYPFKETSLVVELFTRDFGRIGVVARGARRPKSSLRGVLLAFQPLLVSWSGKGELYTLLGAEWQGGNLVRLPRTQSAAYMRYRTRDSHSSGSRRPAVGGS